jgi:hypothetical protein
MSNNILGKLVSLLKRYETKSPEDSKKYYSIIFLIVFVIELIGGYYLAVKYYENYDFTYNSGTVLRIVKILPLILLLIYIYTNKMSKFIDNVENLYWYLFMIIDVIPMLLVYSINGIADNKNVLIFIYSIALIVVIGIYLVSKLDINILSFGLRDTMFWAFIILFSAAGYAYIIHKLGLPKSIKNAFEDIYAVRLNYRNSTGRFVDYFVQWLGNVINPFIFAYLLRKKKFKTALVPFVLEGILYMYTAYRSIFVTLILAPIFAFIISKGVRRRFLEILIGAGLAVGVLMGFAGKLSIYIIAVLRTFLWPPLIALQYYDFYWMYPKMKLSHSIMSHFYKNIYSMEPSFYMGSVYYGRPEMRLNVNWYGDAYMNFGIPGLLVFALILFGILVAIKSLEKKDKYLVASLVFGGIMALFNGPILTTLLTNGLGLGILLAFLLPVKSSI